jgi:integrase/recombinase XerD
VSKRGSQAGRGPEGARPVLARSCFLSNESEEYLSWLVVEQGRSANTVASYRRDLAAYEGYLASRAASSHRAGDGRLAGPARASRSDVEGFVEHLLRCGLSPSSVLRSLACVRGLHRFLLEEGLAMEDPTSGVAGPRASDRLPKALTEAEVLALLQAPRGGDPLALRDRAILELLYATGIRVSELTGLSLSDLRSERGLIQVTGKGSKQRLVPLMGAASAALDRWLGPSGRDRMVPRRWARRGDAEAVFLNARGGRLSRQGVWLVMSRHASAVGLSDKVHPHVLRHSCATHMLEHGADIRVVQELLGHASIVTTQVYTRVSPEHLRRVYEAAHPRAGRRSSRPARRVPAARATAG